MTLPSRASRLVRRRGTVTGIPTPIACSGNPHAIQVARRRTRASPLDGPAAFVPRSCTPARPGRGRAPESHQHISRRVGRPKVSRPRSSTSTRHAGRRRRRGRRPRSSTSTHHASRRRRRGRPSSRAPRPRRQLRPQPANPTSKATHRPPTRGTVTLGFAQMMARPRIERLSGATGFRSATVSTFARRSALRL